jgi:ParB family chromosome partitioning protein
MAIPYVYSFRKSTEGVMRDRLPGSPPVVLEIPVTAVDEENLRTLETAEYKAEAGQLIKDIQEHGLLQPIVVVPSGEGRYRIIAGQKRFIACRQLGWKVVPVVVRKEAVSAAD